MTDLRLAPPGLGAECARFHSDRKDLRIVFMPTQTRHARADGMRALHGVADPISVDAMQHYP